MRSTHRARTRAHRLTSDASPVVPAASAGVSPNVSRDDGRNATADDTRSRLLEAAARTIADRGFAATTVREICRRAGTNVAAVNYHFRSKEALEAETLMWAMSRSPQDPSLEAAMRDAGTTAPDLATVIRGLARQILGAPDDLHARIMMRAMLEPNPALDAVVRDYVEPRIRVLERALAPFLPEASKRKLRLTALSVVSQVVYYRLAAPVALRLLHEPCAPQGFADEIADHVTLFTTNALAGATTRGRRPGAVATPKPVRTTPKGSRSPSPRKARRP